VGYLTSADQLFWDRADTGNSIVQNCKRFVLISLITCVLIVTYISIVTLYPLSHE
jgi:hypothetical protein